MAPSSQGLEPATFPERFTVILARVTREEHLRLGGIYVHHRKLYGWMLKSPVEKLSLQGRRRYAKAGIKLMKVKT